MNILHNFDFDIVIVIVLALGILVGLFGGIVRQLRRTLTSVLPLIIVLILMEPIDKAVANWTGFESAFEAVVGFLKLTPFIRSIRNFFVGAVCYIICFFVIRLLFKLIEGRLLKRQLETVPGWSRAAGAALSIVNSYILLTLILIVAGSCLTFSYSTPLTSAFTQISIPSYPLSELAEYENINPGYEEELDKAYNAITGQDLKDYYESYLAFCARSDVINSRLTQLEARLSEADREILESVLATKTDLLHAAMAPNRNLILLETLNLSEKDEVFADYLALHEADLRIVDVITPSITSLDDFYTTFASSYMTISSNCARAESRARIAQIKDELVYLMRNRDVLKGFLQLEDAESLENYIMRATSVFESEKSIAIYANRFLLDEDFTRTDDYGYVMGKAMTRFIADRGNFSLLPKGLKFSVKMTLLPSARAWYKKHSWEKSALLKAYLADALASTITPGHALYTEYLFSTLLPSFSTISADNLVGLLNSLQELVRDGVLDKACAEAIIMSELTDVESMLYKALDEGVITTSALNELVTREAPFLTKDVKEWLAFIC